MAENQFYRKKMFIPHGRYQREYPFALYLFQDKDNNMAASGYAPSGPMINHAEPMIDELEQPFELDPIWGFTFYLSKELATGIMYDKNQW